MTGAADKSGEMSPLYASEMPQGSQRATETPRSGGGGGGVAEKRSR